MEQYFALLRQCPLFQGISPQELSQMLPCLGTRHMQVKKHQMIFRAGDPARWVGLVLSGAVHVIQEDYYGNRSIVSTFQPPQLFGEAFACAGVASLPVSVEAAQDSTLLLLTQKLSFLSKRTTKEKLMAYLMEEARRAGSPTFRLPYDRQGLADYLGVDRTAMSAELSKLRRAGVLDCKGRDVTLHKSIS